MAGERLIPWEQYTRLLEHLGIPTNVVTASVTLIAGFLLSMLGRRLARGLVRRGGHWLGTLTKAERQLDTSRVEIALGAIVYWAILLFFIMAATETLGLPVVTGWLAEVANYVPRVIASILIVAIGGLLARLSRQLVTKAASTTKTPGAVRLGRVAELALFVSAALIALDQLGVEVSFLKTTLLILLAAMLGGAALAFGLGCRELVANVLSSHYIQRIYQAGQTIRFQDVHGRIVRITDIAVIVETEEGEVVVPAVQLTAERSTLVLRAGAQ